MKKQEVLYLAVTADELELPLVVCDSVRELAKWAGCTVNHMWDKLRRQSRDYRNDCIFLRVVLPDDFTLALENFYNLYINYNCRPQKIVCYTAPNKPKGGIIFYGKSKKEKTDNGIEGASKGEE